MDTAVDLTTGVQVEAVVVATVGVGAVEGVEGVGWAITLTLHLLLASTVLFLSLVLGLMVFLAMEGALVLGCGHVGHGWFFFFAAGSRVGARVRDQVYHLVLDTFSSFG